METTREDITKRIEARAYDFIDFGSSTGGSIGYCMRRFRASRGLGIDIKPAEVEKIRASGFDAVQADIMSFECPPGSFRFVSMMDFLEHLPDLQCVERVLARAKRMARDFLFIRHPSFEDEHYLSAVGLKQFWTDWPGGHTAKLTVADFSSIFRRLELNQHCISFRGPAIDSDDPAMLPISAPPNQHAYDADRHGRKPCIVFPRPIYGQIDLFVALHPFPDAEWAKIIAIFD